jgi:large subunit ribosomal protein L10
LAFSKQHKGVIQEQYVNWLKKSQAMIMVEYSGLNMKGINAIRSKAREAGGEFHVVKNTLLTNVFKQQNIAVDEKLLSGSTAVGFAFNDAPAMAKAMTDFVKGNEVFKVKGGYLGNQALNAKQIKALADLPPLPVMRGKLLGVLQAPAAKLVRTLAEPARGLASVVRAHSEQGA